jgi:hypothetical protein
MTLQTGARPVEPLGLPRVLNTLGKRKQAGLFRGANRGQTANFRQKGAGNSCQTPVCGALVYPVERAYSHRRMSLDGGKQVR